MAFQVMSPVNERTALLPHALVLHINPQNLSETHNKKVERIQTMGGWVEQHWPDELSEFTADQVTGSFMNIKTGLSSLVRQRTIAWSRFRDLYDLYRNNGSVYGPDGSIVLQGQILLMFDRGSYYGTFRNFRVEETADSPFMFKLNWTFKVERTVTSIPRYHNQNQARAPLFQGTNAAPIQVTAPIQTGVPPEPVQGLDDILPPNITAEFGPTGRLPQ
jgi:hypothetical protein